MGIRNQKNEEDDKKVILNDISVGQLLAKNHLRLPIYQPVPLTRPKPKSILLVAISQN